MTGQLRWKCFRARNLIIDLRRLRFGQYMNDTGIETARRTSIERQCNFGQIA